MSSYYKNLISTLLLEHSSFGGEFWIQDVYVQSADSNIDMGHEAYAIQAAADEVLSELGIYKDEPYLPDMDDELYEAMEDSLPEEIKLKYDNDDLSIIELLDWYCDNVLKNPDFKETIAVAFDRPNSDPRRFAMKKYGWQAIRGVEIDTWVLTKETLKQISNGLGEVYGDDIEEYQTTHSEVDANGYKGPYFGIEVYSRKDYYSNVPIDIIDAADISKLQLYRTITRGQRIQETGELVGKIKLEPKPTVNPDVSLQHELDLLASKFNNHLYINVYAYDAFIKLEGLMAKKDAPTGTGSMFMNELIKIADKHSRIIVLTPANKKYGGGIYKKTTSFSRLATFYKRFGFVSNYSKRDYSPYLDGTMHRRPK
jgi:hypothetical protein